MTGAMSDAPTVADAPQRLPAAADRARDAPARR